MARQYKLKQFLRYLDDGLTTEYLRHIGIKKELPVRGKEENPSDYWERVIRELPQNEVDRIELGFQEINEIALESGVLSLLQVARDSGVDLAGEISQIENEHNKALHCFLKHPEIFDNAATLHWVDELRSKKERVGLKIRTAEETTNRKDALAEALRHYFIACDGRGQHCHVDTYAFPNRVCLIAYPEDYAQSDIHYEGDQLKRASRRPCFEVVYIYFTDVGRLELFAKGGKDREQELMDIFNRVVLEDDKPLAPLQKVYDLNKLFDENLELTTELDDQIEDVRVKQLRFDFKFGGQRITLEMNKDGGLKPMQELMKHKGMTAQYYNITQARIYLKFQGKGRKGSVTMQITSPDKCNLNDSALHLKAKKYLTLWGLEAPIAKPTTV